MRLGNVTKEKKGANIFKNCYTKEYTTLLMMSTSSIHLFNNYFPGTGFLEVLGDIWECHGPSLLVVGTVLDATKSLAIVIVYSLVGAHMLRK